MITILWIEGEGGCCFENIDRDWFCYNPDQAVLLLIEIVWVRVWITKWQDKDLEGKVLDLWRDFCFPTFAYRTSDRIIFKERIWKCFGYVVRGHALTRKSDNLDRMFSYPYFVCCTDTDATWMTLGQSAVGTDTTPILACPIRSWYDTTLIFGVSMLLSTF